MSNKITPDFPPVPNGAGIYIAKHTELLPLRGKAFFTGGVVYYGANTCWWTCDPVDLYTRKYDGLRVNGQAIPEGRLPCDPRGGMLLEAHDVNLFFNEAVHNVSHYGKHGIRAFLAAYHGNVVVSETDTRPTCFSQWHDYNRLLDEFDERGK